MVVPGRSDRPTIVHDEVGTTDDSAKIRDLPQKDSISMCSSRVERLGYIAFDFFFFFALCLFVVGAILLRKAMDECDENIHESATTPSWALKLVCSTIVVPQSEL